MIFCTENSTYEVDAHEFRIRRINGVSDPTPRQGKDGEWKTYHAVTTIKPGHAVLIVWDIVDGVARSTQTSTVTEVQGNGTGEQEALLQQELRSASK